MTPSEISGGVLKTTNPESLRYDLKNRSFFQSGKGSS